MRRKDVAQPAVVLAAQRVGVLLPQPGPHPCRAREIGEQDRRRGAPALHLGRRLVRRGRASQQGWIVREDRPLQVLEFGSRTQAELGVERPHGIAVDTQGLPLAPGAIKGQHQLRPQPLPQRLPPHKRLELAHQLHPATRREVGLDAVLNSGRPQLLEAGDLGRREGLEGHIGQRRATPLLERRA